MQIKTDIFRYDDSGLEKLFDSFAPKKAVSLFKGAERRAAVRTRNVAKQEMAAAVKGSNVKLQHAIWIRTFRHSAGFKVSVFPIRNTTKGYYLSRHAQKLRTAYAKRQLPVPLFLERGTVARYRHKVSWGARTRRGTGVDTVRETGLSHDRKRRGYTGKLRTYGYMYKARERSAGFIREEFERSFIALVAREVRRNGLV